MFKNSSTGRNLLGIFLTLLHRLVRNLKVNWPFGLSRSKGKRLLKTQKYTLYIGAFGGNYSELAMNRASLPQ
jgi:hypothetical protein